MQISKNLVEETLATLPISYYLLDSIPVILSDTAPTSYIDLIERKIYLSMRQFSKINCDESEVEQYVRSMLYHELSHALLSPIINEPICDQNALLIFEDERIETLLRNHYMNTNFKSLLSSVSPYKEPTNKVEAFFVAVRYRIGPPGFSEAVDLIINKYAKLNDFSPEEMKINYQKDIQTLYDKLFEKIEESMEAPGGSKITAGDYFSSYQEYLSAKYPTDDKEKDGFNLVKTVVENLPNYGETKIRKRIEEILYLAKTPRGINGSSKLCFSGKLSPRHVAKPNSNYKWFTKKGDGYLKKNRKVLINIFADCSGSFWKNEDKFNAILRELVYLERIVPDFEFNLALIKEDRIEITPKNKRYITCGGENSVNSDWKHKFIKLQNQNYKTINFIFLDGYMSTKTVRDPNTGAHLEMNSESQFQYLKYINFSNVAILSDPTNMQFLEAYCNRARKVYTTNYLQEIENNIIKILQSLL